MEWTKEQKKEVLSFILWADLENRPLNRKKTSDEDFKALWKEFKESGYKARGDNGLWDKFSAIASWDPKDIKLKDDIWKKHGITISFVKEKVESLGLV